MSDQAERTARLKTVLAEIDSLMRDVGPKWIRLAHLNNEAKLIAEELKREEDESL